MSLKIGLLGCGTIGTEIATAIDNGQIRNAKLTAVFDHGQDSANKLVRDITDSPVVVDSVTELIDRVSLIVEAAGQSAVEETALQVLEADTDLMMMSVGALADQTLRKKVLSEAESNSARLYVPSGAIAGLDAIKASALAGGLHSVSLTTRKPPGGLEGAPYLLENDIDISELDSPRTVFEGRATEAAQAFPSNINVAIALSLAGIGPNKTTVQIIADPDESNNVHQIEAVGDAGEIETVVRNVPSPTNEKTSYLAALSGIEKLRGITTTTSVGT